jgi:hypothetical protein
MAKRRLSLYNITPHPFPNSAVSIAASGSRKEAITVVTLPCASCHDDFEFSYQIYQKAGSADGSLHRASYPDMLMLFEVIILGRQHMGVRQN